MTVGEPPGLKRIVAAALRRPASERAGYLEAACADDAALRTRAARLVALERSAASMFANPPVASVTPDRLPRVEGYEVRRLVAVGGMGAVYEAVQLNPRRPVALKLMRTSVLTTVARRRFEHEASTLGRLRHPGIAQIYESGVCEDSGGAVPFFAMELVSGGRPITAFAEDESLVVVDRLRLFAKVCDAVQHGHQHGVIHRDLKPANVLVDASGEPKVIDFGVARTIDADVTLTTPDTDPGQLVGTLVYMSPEQCAADPAAIDTRSDVYALGVLLYELLCGHLPYDLRDRGLPEIATVIRTGPARRPSSVRAELRGDLDAIVLKTLEKEPVRRYQTATALAGDLERFLAHQPIEARPPSMTYQLRLFARRHRGLVGGLAAAGLVLLGATVVSSVLTVAASRQRQAALAAQSEAETQRAAAVAARERSERLSSYLRSTIFFANPKRGGHAEAKGALLDLIAAGIAERFADDPAMEAGLRHDIGDAYWTLGRFDEAERHLRRGLALRRVVEPALSEAYISDAIYLTDLLIVRGKSDAAEAILLAILDALPDDHPRVPWVLHGLGVVSGAQGAYERGREHLDRALAATRARLGPHHEDVANLLLARGQIEHDAGEIGQAAVHVREALAVRRVVFGEESVLVAQAMGFVAELLAGRGTPADLAEAETLLREVLRMLPGLVGEDHLDLAWARTLLAGVLFRQGRHDEAEAMYREALALKRRLLGGRHHQVALTLWAYGGFLHSLGRDDEAKVLWTEVLDIRREAFGDDHPETRRAAEGLASLRR